MPADGKVNAAGVGNGQRILVTRVGDRLEPARAKTSALVATIENKTKVTVASAAGHRSQGRYTLYTDIGPVEDVAAIQTFWLATNKQVADAKAKKPVPPAQFSAPVVPEPRTTELVTANANGRTRVVARPHTTPEPSQDAPGFKNGQRLYETVPESATPRCVDRDGCTEQATQQVARRPHIRYCPRHGAEFEVRQQYVIDPWELEAIR